MDTSLVLSQIIVFIGAIIICFVCVYYIQYSYKKNKKKSNKHNFINPIASENFHFTGSNLIHNDEASSKNTTKSKDKNYKLLITLVIPILLTISTIPYFYKYTEAFRNNIFNSTKDKQEYNSEENLSFIKDINRLPSLKQTLSNINKSIIILDGLEENETTNSWKNFFKKHEISYTICFIHNLSDCQTQLSKDENILFTSINNILQPENSNIIYKNNNILTYGYSELNKARLESLGLAFKKNKTKKSDYISLISDKELSLQLKGIESIYAPSLNHNWLAISTNSQAISFQENGIAGGSRDSRLHVNNIEGSKIIWADFSPQILDSEDQNVKAIFVNLFRYLNNYSYTDIATWPNNKKMAAIIAQDTEEGFSQSNKVAHFFYENKIPITWYILSNLAEKYQATTKYLAKTGIIACHGNNHEAMNKYNVLIQSEKINQCKNTLSKITDINVEGFRPPLEGYNFETLRALINLNFSHIFVKTKDSSGLPKIIKGENNNYLVVIPRINTDDYYLWHTLKKDHKSSIDLLKDEISWIYETGGLYTFSFHSQFMKNDKNLKTVKDISLTLFDSEDVFLTNTNTLASWWKFRNHLATFNKENITLGEIEKFRPFHLKVDKEGILIKTLITAKNLEILKNDKEQP